MKKIKKKKAVKKVKHKKKKLVKKKRRRLRQTKRKSRADKTTDGNMGIDGSQSSDAPGPLPIAEVSETPIEGAEEDMYGPSAPDIDDMEAETIEDEEY